MKADELMFGDWVYYSNNPQRIKGAMDFTIAKGFYPITLTPEILEKNGFVFAFDEYIDDKVKVTFETQDQFSAINIEGSETNPNLEIMFPCEKILYVHELQHALRLCGLNRLADNFMV